MPSPNTIALQEERQKLRSRGLIRIIQSENKDGMPNRAERRRKAKRLARMSRVPFHFANLILPQFARQEPQKFALL